MELHIVTGAPLRSQIGDWLRSFHKAIAKWNAGQLSAGIWPKKLAEDVALLSEVATQSRTNLPAESARRRGCLAGQLVETAARY